MGERLQKILAHAGVASRRQAEELIAQGRVRVNGHVVQEMGVRADPRADTITVDGQRIRKIRKFTYILLNKPRNVMSTVTDPEGRPTVIDIVGDKSGTRLYPVGRLDFGSEGLLILTNDGDFTRFMTRAGSAAKVYGIKVSGVPSPRTLDRLRRGTRIDGRSYAPCEIRTVSEDSNSWYEVTLHEGQNRQLRRMFEALGHRVMRLRRTQIGFLTAPTLAPGKWRHLTSREVQEFYRRYANDLTVGDGGSTDERRRRPAPNRDKRVAAGRRVKAASAEAERPAGRRGPRPASSAGKRPAAGHRVKAASAEAERPAGGRGPRPASSAGKRPAAGHRVKAVSAEAERPAGGRGPRPASSAGKRPAAGRRVKVVSAKDERPAGRRGPRPASSAGKGPAAGRRPKRAPAGDKRPAAGRRAKSTSAGNRRQGGSPRPKPTASGNKPAHRSHR